MADSAVSFVPAENRLVWRLGQWPTRVEGIQWGDQAVTLAALADTGAGILIEVVARQPFELEVELDSAVFYESVPAGRTRYMLTYLDRSDVRRL